MVRYFQTGLFADITEHDVGLGVVRQVHGRPEEELVPGTDPAVDGFKYIDAFAPETVAVLEISIPPAQPPPESGLVDRDTLKRLDEALRTRLVEIEKRIFSAAGGEINLNSPKQLGELLFDKLHLPVIKRTKTGYSTDVSVLEELARLPEPLGEIPAKIGRAHV